MLVVYEDDVFNIFFYFGYDLGWLKPLWSIYALSELFFIMKFQKSL